MCLGVWSGCVVYQFKGDYSCDFTGTVLCSVGRVGNHKHLFASRPCQQREPSASVCWIWEHDYVVVSQGHGCCVGRMDAHVCGLIITRAVKHCVWRSPHCLWVQEYVPHRLYTGLRGCATWACLILVSAVACCRCCRHIY